MIKNPESLFKQISLGVYIIGVSDGIRQNAFTAAWVMQVSFKPPLLAISINPHSHSYQILKTGGICSVNVLSQSQAELAEHFGQSAIDKMSGHQWQSAQTGAPILSGSLAYFDCKVSHYTKAGDHMVAICTVVSAAELNEGQPLLYKHTGDLDGSSQLYN